MVRLVFYGEDGGQIGVGEFFILPHLEGRPSDGKWRFKLALGYKNPRPKAVCAGDMLDKHEWQELRTGQTHEGKLYVNLHPRDPSDWVYLTLTGDGQILSGSWVYRTDGGLIEKGRFSAVPK